MDDEVGEEKPELGVVLEFKPKVEVTTDEEEECAMACPECDNPFWILMEFGEIKCGYCHWVMEEEEGED